MKQTQPTSLEEGGGAMEADKANDRDRKSTRGYF